LLIFCSKLDEVAAKQRQREEEAEQRLLKQRAERLGAVPAAAPAATPAAATGQDDTRWRPSARPSWREREAAKAAGGEARSPAPVAAAAADAPTERPRLNLQPRSVPKEDVAPPAPAAPSPPTQVASPPPEKKTPPYIAPAYKRPGATSGEAPPSDPPRVAYVSPHLRNKDRGEGRDRGDSKEREARKPAASTSGGKWR